MKFSPIHALALSATLISGLPAFAAGKVIAKCTNGEETTVVLKQVDNDKFEAAVTVQSTGDSYPTYHYKNITVEPPMPHRIGGATVYKGNGFELSIVYTAAKAPATLNVPEVGLKNEELTCR